MEVRMPEPFLFKGIGISGKMCSGKTTLAKYISETRGYPVVSLATALKEDVKGALKKAGLAVRKDQMFTKHKAQIRPMLQLWGELFRYFNGENWWVDRLFTDNDPPFVVDDVRYQNEVEGLRERGFLIIRLAVPRDVQLARIERLYPLARMSDLTHASETALDSYYNFDAVIFNYYTNDLHSLYNKFEEVTRLLDLPSMPQQLCHNNVPEVRNANMPLVRE